MPFANDLITLSIETLVALFFMIVAYHFQSFISMALQMILAPRFRTKVRRISIVGFKYEKNDKGKWESRGHKPGIGFSADLVYDMKKCAGFTAKQFKAKELLLLLTVGITNLLIGAGVMTGCLFGARGIGHEFFASKIRIFGISWFLFTLANLILMIIVMAKLDNKNSLSSYYQQALSMIREGVPYEQMDLKSIRELNLSKAYNTEKLAYLPVYFEYLDCCGLFDKMPEAVNEIESILRPQADTSAEIFCTNALIYYYSYHCINPALATKYYQMAGDHLLKDNDSGAMRIKAFYELNCCHNLERAKEYAAKANEKIEDFSVGSEREYERKCIARLEEAIRQYQSPGQSYNVYNPPVQ